MTSAAAYVRVSSRSQDASTQRDAIARAARARGDAIAQWWSDQRSAVRERPGLAALRAAVRAGEVRRLYVFRLDRLSRSGIRDALGLLEELRGAGCEVVTIADGFDLGGPVADVVIAVMSWAAQMERLAIGERIAAARTRVEASGGAWGRPRRLTDATVERIRSMRSAKRMSVRQIAVALRIPRSTVGAVLSEKGAYARTRGRAEKSPRRPSHPPPSE